MKSEWATHIGTKSVLAVWIRGVKTQGAAQKQGIDICDIFPHRLAPETTNVEKFPFLTGICPAYFQYKCIFRANPAKMMKLSPARAYSEAGEGIA